MAINNIINLHLFGTELGRIGLDENKSISSFQYNPDFLAEGKMLNVFPLTGIIRRVPQAQIFNQYNTDTFKNLPPQIADSLPDLFGNLIFKTWLTANDKSDINVLEQLAYVSNRGMGALEYVPSKDVPSNATINLDEIIEVLQSVLDNKRSSNQDQLNNEALINIFKIGSSAGGVRPKILISEHKQNGTIIPGDIAYSDTYLHYIVKLALDDNTNYPREIVEYCYYLTAKEVGIHMMPSKLIDNKHYATQRYDRQDGAKQHVLTATGMTGWDFQKAANSSYENLFSLCSFLKLPQSQIEDLYRRMIFNIVFCNTDDHLKNHSFIYDQHKDRWSLSPAYDLTFALNPLINFTKTNRALSINGKRNNINIKDVLHIADQYTIKNPKGIIVEINQSLKLLQRHMREQDVPIAVQEGIMRSCGGL